jgi:hypothetical protein
VPGLNSRAWNAQGDVHDPATWSAPRRIAQSNGFALPDGPRGLWLVYADFNHGGRNPVLARKRAGEKFCRGHRVPHRSASVRCCAGSDAPTRMSCDRLGGSARG